jgi:hypothetical protein
MIVNEKSLFHLPIVSSLEEDWKICLRRYFALGIDMNYKLSPDDFTLQKKEEGRIAFNSWIQNHISSIMDLINSQKYSVEELLTCNIQPIRVLVKVVSESKKESIK